MMVKTGTSALYILRVQNDGASAGSFIITGIATGTGWMATFRDAKNTDITAQVTGSGWNTGALAAGEFRTLTVQVIPGRMAVSGSLATVQVTAASVSNPDWRDVAKTITTLQRPPQPDLWVRTLADAAFTGDNVYNATGVGQTRALTIAHGLPATYMLRVQNDGNAAERFVVTGPTGGNGWIVSYYDTATNTDITSQVTGKGWQTNLLQAMQTQGLWVKVNPVDGLAGNKSRSLMIFATAKSTPACRDAVIVTTTLAPLYQPDLWVRTASETIFHGDNIYSTDGITQLAALNLHGSQSAAFFFRVQNDGNLPDTFTLTGPASDSPLDINISQSGHRQRHHRADHRQRLVEWYLVPRCQYRHLGAYHLHSRSHLRHLQPAAHRGISPRHHQRRGAVHGDLRAVRAMPAE